MKYPLSIEEKNELKAYEVIIKTGMDFFLEVGSALLNIRDKKLYRESHQNFESYCKEKWGFTIRHADRLMLSTRVVDNLKTGPIGPLPGSESQARPLTHLELEEQKEVWNKAVETAPGGKITAKHVEKVLKEMIQPKAQKIAKTKLDIKKISWKLQEMKERAFSIERQWQELSKTDKKKFIVWAQGKYESESVFGILNERR